MIFTKTRRRLERRRDAHAMRAERHQPITYRWYTPAGFIHPGEQHGHLATTAHVQAIYPFVSQSSLGNRGVLIGNNLYGGPFAMDPWSGYAEGWLHDPNMLILGLKDHGKSALTKTWCYRQHAIGRRVEVIDRKSEYERVIKEGMGGQVIRLAPGVRLNPLERIGSASSRISLLRAVTRALLGRELTPDERVGLSAALIAVNSREQDEVVIPMIVDELRDPSPEVAAELNVTQEQAGVYLREAMLVLRDISIGPLQDMFDGPTTAGSQVWDSDAISLDISGIAQHTYGADENTALAIALICCTAFLDGRRIARTEANPGQEKRTIRVNDEAWRALSVPGATDYYTAALKLSRQTGQSHIIVLHKLTDLSAAGDAGSRTQKLAEGLASETAIRVVYCQAEQEANLTAQALQLNATERDLITSLPQGEALWRVGQLGFRVRHQISDLEWDLVQSDEGMGTRTPRTVGRP